LKRHSIVWNARSATQTAKQRVEEDAHEFWIPGRGGSTLGGKVLATLGVSYFISAMPKTKAIASYVPPLLDLAKKIEASVTDLTRVQ
jgi:hypothetical protein